MNVRIAKGSHLGERRFLEYPQITADEWGLQREFAQRLLTPGRVVGGVALLLTLAAGALLILR